METKKGRRGVNATFFFFFFITDVLLSVMKILSFLLHLFNCSHLNKKKKSLTLHCEPVVVIPLK